MPTTPDNTTTTTDTDTITLTEWSDTDPIALTAADRDYLTTTINDTATRLAITPHNADTDILSARHYVGAITLPSDCTIQITPKAAGDNFLALLAYADRLSIHDTTLPDTTSLTTGVHVFDALAAHYADELETLLQRTNRLHRETTWRAGYTGSRVNPAELARFQAGLPNAKPLKRKVTSYDTPPNQLLLAAADTLADRVTSHDLRHRLDRLARTLTAHYDVTNPHQPTLLANDVSPNNHRPPYPTLLDLATCAVTDTFGIEFTAGNRATPAYLTNMHPVFEEVVTTALTEVTDTTQVTTHPTDTQITGPTPIDLQPDVTLTADDSVELVADAKWKTQLDTTDLYQLHTYQTAYDAPGILFYPTCDTEIAGTYTIGDTSLYVQTLPTATAYDTPGAFHDALEDAVTDAISPLVPDRVA